MAYGFWIVGLILTWLSVPVIGLGTYLQKQSPRYIDYYHAFHPETFDPGPDTVILETTAFDRAAALESESWEVSCIFSGFFAMLFTFGVVTILGILQCNQTAAFLVACGFTMGCSLGWALGVAEAIHHFKWGFFTLSVGFLLAGSGLLMGAVGLVWAMLVFSGREPAAVR